MENNRNDKSKIRFAVTCALLAAVIAALVGLTAAICVAVTKYPNGGAADKTGAYAELTEKYKYNAVELKVLSTYGSAFVYTFDGGDMYLFTNKHVVEDALSDSNKITARFYGKNVYYDTGYIELVGYSTEYDIALLKTKTYPKNPYVDLKKQGLVSNIAVQGEEILCLGNNLGFGIQAQNGIVSRDSMVKTLSGNVIAVIGACIPLNQGNSGSALYNTNGKLIGMTTWRVDTVNSESGGKPVDSTNFLTPAPIIAAVFENLVGRNLTGEVDFPMTVMNIENVTYGSMLVHDMQTTFAFEDFLLKVTKINTLTVPLEVGDVVKKFGSVTVKACNFPSVLGELFLYSPSGKGDPLTLEIERGGKTLTVKADKLKRI